MRIKKEIYDISVPLQSNLVSWPGEEGFTRKEKRDGGITISTIHCGSHTGTHVDAPKHFIIRCVRFWSAWVSKQTEPIR